MHVSMNFTVETFVLVALVRVFSANVLCQQQAQSHYSNPISRCEHVSGACYRTLAYRKHDACGFLFEGTELVFLASLVNVSVFLRAAGIFAQKWNSLCCGVATSGRSLVFLQFGHILQVWDGSRSFLAKHASLVKQFGTCGLVLGVGCPMLRGVRTGSCSWNLSSRFRYHVVILGFVCGKVQLAFWENSPRPHLPIFLQSF
jgi:hypothetical protein